MAMASMVKDSNWHMATGDLAAPLPILSSGGLLLGARAQRGVCW